MTDQELCPRCGEPDFQEEGELVEGFAKELGGKNVFGTRTFTFHSHQTNPKAVPYEGPMPSATLILHEPEGA